MQLFYHKVQIAQRSIGLPTFNACHTFFTYIFLVFQEATPQWSLKHFLIGTLIFSFQVIFQSWATVCCNKNKTGTAQPMFGYSHKDNVGSLRCLSLPRTHQPSLRFSCRAFIFVAGSKINLLWLAFYLLFHTVKSLLGHTVDTSVCQTGTYLNI